MKTLRPAATPAGNRSIGSAESKSAREPSALPVGRIVAVRSVPRANGRAEEEISTRERIIHVALAAFGSDGFHATSLDSLATSLGVTKQTVLHHFGSKDGVLAATTETAATLLANAVDTALAKPGTADERLTRVVRAIFALAARRPELLGFVRELSRLGSAPLANLRTALAPFLARASAFVADEMLEPAIELEPEHIFPGVDAQQLASQPVIALNVVLAGYAAVLAAAAEVEVLRSLGVAPSGRLFLRRRREVIEYLRFLAGQSAAAPSNNADNEYPAPVNGGPGSPVGASISAERLS